MSASFKSERLRKACTATVVTEAPELNPVEDPWRLMPDNYLSNQIFENCEEIVDH